MQIGHQAQSDAMSLLAVVCPAVKWTPRRGEILATAQQWTCGVCTMATFGSGWKYGSRSAKNERLFPGRSGGSTTAQQHMYHVTVTAQ